MEYVTKGKLQKTLHVWFCEDSINPTIKHNVDVIRYHGIKKKPKLIEQCNEQNTLITNLSEKEENIFSKFTSNTRNEIRRAKREGIVTKQFDSSKIKEHPEILKQLAKMYQEMYAEKGMSAEVNLSELKQINSTNGLLLTAANYQKQTIIFHVYIIDEDNARLLYSCSNFRILSKESQKIIGWANRLLHWNDMLYLKNSGISSYDWGGIASFENPNGIDKFKLSFNGEKIIYYNLTYFVSKKAKMLKNIKK